MDMKNQCIANTDDAVSSGRGAYATVDRQGIPLCPVLKELLQE
jgi:hypothetical protein